MAVGLGPTGDRPGFKSHLLPINCVVDFGQVITSVCHAFSPHHGDSNISHLMGLL